jgi:thiol-disulfide isomerase/thioredoxin
MIKVFFILFILIGNLGFSQVIRVDFDKYGRSGYDKMFKKKHALPFYLVEKGVYQTQLPIRKFNDTLQVRLIKKKNRYFPENIECLNQKDKPWKFSYDTEKRLITVKSDELEESFHLYDLPSREGRFIIAGYTGNQLTVDTSEWLGIERKRIMYGDLKIKDKVYTIARVNLNRTTSRGFDVSAISIDTSGSIYKIVVVNARCNRVSKTKYLDFEGNYFKTNNIDPDFIEIEKCDEVIKDSTIYFDTNIRESNYVFEGNDLDYRSLLEDGEYLVLNIFSEYCPPCINDFPKLNKLQKKYEGKVTILGLFEGNQNDLTRLEETFSVTYPLGILNPEIKKDLLQGGFPYKALISPNGEIIKLGIRSTESLEEVLETIF